MPREWALSRPTSIYKPLKQIESLALSLDKTRDHQMRYKWATRSMNPASGAPNYSTCQLFESRASISNGHFQTTRCGQEDTGCVWCTPDPYAERVFFVQGTAREPPDMALSTGPLLREQYKHAGALNTRIVSSPRLMLSIRCLVFTCARNRECTRCRFSVRCLWDQRLVNVFPVKNTPMTSSNFPLVQ